MEPASEPARSGPARAFAIVARLGRKHLLARIDRRVIALRWQPAAADLPPRDWALHSFAAFADLPPGVFGQGDSGGVAEEGWYCQFFDQGAVLWTALEQGRPIGWLWIVEAARLRGWYLPLEPGARVIYGVVTAGPARGRGVAAQLALAAAQDAHAAGHAVWLDCKAWNRPALRAFAKAGFRPVATLGRRFGRAPDGPR